MSDPLSGPGSRQPSRAPYVVAAALFGAAILIVAVLAVVFLRAISGYTVTRVEPGEPTPITIGERNVAVWSSPEVPPATCQATDASGDDANRVDMFADPKVSDGGRTWHQVNTIHGPPGTYTLTCEPISGAEFGYGPSPRFGWYVFLGVVGGGAAAVMTVASFVILLVTILRRRKQRMAW